MSNIVPVTSIGALGSGPSILGESQAQLPTHGTIRAGIKVLTHKLAANELAARIYERGVSAGKDYSEIEKVIRAKVKLGEGDQAKPIGDRQLVMVPKNVPYFTARVSDFPRTPKVPGEIWDAFSETKVIGDEEIEGIFTFPVALPTDNWQANMPHNLKAWRKSGIAYWSEYRDGERYCFRLADVVVDEKSKRARKLFGGRKGIPRENDGEYQLDGRCEPEACPTYQEGKCKLTGKLLFYIPGIASGTSCMQLPTTSVYAMKQWREMMETVSFLFGRISGTHHGEPLFWITKEWREVSSIDQQTGEAKRRGQWITVLESTVDTTSIIDDAHDARDAANLLTRDEEQPPPIEGESWQEED